MQIHGPSHLHGPQTIGAPHRTPATANPPQAGRSGPVDQLDISPQADLVSRTREVPAIREAKVAAIKADIAAGTYETPEKLEAALDRLLDEIG
jgi:negative regulator of flagellin synthesis FlgM